MMFFIFWNKILIYFKTLICEDYKKESTIGLSVLRRTRNSGHSISRNGRFRMVISETNTLLTTSYYGYF